MNNRDLYKSYLEELKNLIKGDVDISDETLSNLSHDWSIFSIRPELAVFPKDKEDIKKLVNFVNEKRKTDPFVSVTARAAGTDMSGGPLTHSIVCDTSRYMKGVISLKEGNFGEQSPLGRKYKIAGMVTVLPGTYYRDFEKVLNEKDLEMPCFPASKELCAVGGMVANNGAGEKTLKYGQNKHFVESLKVVLYDGEEYEIKKISKNELDAISLEKNARGEIYRHIWNLIKRNDEEIKNARPKTPKNASGYLLWDVWDEATQTFDPTKLFVGAQGTTGIITEITYKLIKKEHKSKLAVYFVRHIDALPKLTAELGKLDLETLEMYDDHTLLFSLRFIKDFIKKDGFWGTIKSLSRFIPDLLVMARHGIPKLIVLAEFVSNDERELEFEIKKAKDIGKKLKIPCRLAKNHDEEEKYWKMRRDSFKILTEHTKQAKASFAKGEKKPLWRTAPFIDDVCIRPEFFPSFLPELNAILKEYDLTFTVVGHVGSGNLHVIPFMNFASSETLPIILELSDKVYNLVKKYNGTSTAEHNDGIIRGGYLPLFFSEKMMGVFKELKDITDPLKIFNPGKKIEAKISDIERYIMTPPQKL